MALLSVSGRALVALEDEVHEQVSRLVLSEDTEADAGILIDLILRAETWLRHEVETGRIDPERGEASRLLWQEFRDSTLDLLQEVDAHDCPLLWEVDSLGPGASTRQSGAPSAAAAV